MVIYLIRHGESIGNTKQGFLSGQTDVGGLSEKGKIQAMRTVWELKNEPIEQIFTSPVARTQETAEIIAQFLDKKPIKTEFLTELHHGIFEGKFWWEVIHRIPPSWRAKREDFRTPYPKGESMEMMARRVCDGFEEALKKLDPRGVYVFISHQAIITTMRYFLENGREFLSDTSKEKEYMKYLHAVKLENACIAVVDYEGNKLQSIQEVSKFEPIKPDKNSIAFYAKQVLELQKMPVAENMITASKNAVYKILEPKAALVKVIRDNDKTVFARQIKIYTYLAEATIPAPRILHIDDSKIFFGDDALIQDYQNGDEVKKCFKNHPEKVEPLLMDILKTLKKIHSIPVSEVSHFWNPPKGEQFSSWDEHMTYNINMTLHMIQEDIFTKETHEKISEDLTCLKDHVRAKKYQKVPIHGDLSSGNIIISHENGCHLTRIIDFESARIGDALWDYAYFWGWLERESAFVANVWQKIVATGLSAAHLITLNQYRMLFHAWTVRDMTEYKDSTIRQRRGAKSKEILEG